MTKQTAVDFFHDEVNKLLPKKIITTNDIGLIRVKAKEMEKEKIINAFEIGSDCIYDLNLPTSAKQYYNEKYGGNK